MTVNVFVSEYDQLLIDNDGRAVPAPQEPAIATQTLAFTASDTITAFNNKTRFVRIIADAKAHFVVGASPTATANDPYIPANFPVFFGVERDSSTNLTMAFYDGTS